MDAFFVWLESTALSTWVRDAPTLFAFPAMLIAHAVGMGLLAGMNAAIDLRILGAAPDVPLPQMRRFFPFMWLGFALNASSGVMLLIGYPTKALTNPVFYLKLALIAAALVVLRIISRDVVGDDGPKHVMPAKAKGLAVASLACWTAAITAGRMLAYTYTRLTALP
jgi:hypothetical protein